MILTEPTMFDTFECLTAVDVIVGSESLFSESVSALSTNVKVRNNPANQKTCANSSVTGTAAIALIRCEAKKAARGVNNPPPPLSIRRWHALW